MSEFDSKWNEWFRSQVYHNQSGISGINECLEIHHINNNHKDTHPLNCIVLTKEEHFLYTNEEYIKLASKIWDNSTPINPNTVLYDLDHYFYEIANLKLAQFNDYQKNGKWNNVPPGEYVCKLLNPLKDKKVYWFVICEGKYKDVKICFYLDFYKNNSAEMERYEKMLDVDNLRNAPNNAKHYNNIFFLINVKQNNYHPNTPIIQILKTIGDKYERLS